MIALVLDNNIDLRQHFIDNNVDLSIALESFLSVELLKDLRFIFFSKTFIYFLEQFNF